MTLEATGLFSWQYIFTVSQIIAGFGRGITDNFSEDGLLSCVKKDAA